MLRNIKETYERVPKVMVRILGSSEVIQGLHTTIIGVGLQEKSLLSLKRASLEEPQAGKELEKKQQTFLCML